MNKRKYDNMLSTFNGHHGPMTVEAIYKTLPPEIKKLSGKQIGRIMTEIDAAYKKGKNSAGAEMLEDGSVWVDCLRESYHISQLFELSKKNQEKNDKERLKKEFIKNDELKTEFSTYENYLQYIEEKLKESLETHKNSNHNIDTSNNTSGVEILDNDMVWIERFRRAYDLNKPEDLEQLKYGILMLEKIRNENND